MDLPIIWIGAFAIYMVFGFKLLRYLFSCYGKRKPDGESIWKTWIVKPYSTIVLLLIWPLIAMMFLPDIKKSYFPD